MSQEFLVQVIYRKAIDLYGFQISYTDIFGNAVPFDCNVNCIFNTLTGCCGSSNQCAPLTGRYDAQQCLNCYRFYFFFHFTNTDVHVKEKEQHLVLEMVVEHFLVLVVIKYILQQMCYVHVLMLFFIILVFILNFLLQHQ